MQTAHLKQGALFVMLLMFLGGFQQVYGQRQRNPDQKAVEKEVTYKDNGSINTVRYGYLEYLPQNYENPPSGNEEGWPLLIQMVGVGERGFGTTADLDTLRGIAVSKLIEQGRQFPFVIVSAQPTGDRKKPLNNDTNPGMFVPDTLAYFVDQMIEKYNVDPNRVYITAMSAAAVEAARYMAAQPNKIAAFLPIAGNTRDYHFRGNFCNLSTIPIWAFHNLDDKTIASAGSRGFISDLKKCDPAPVVRPKVTIYPGNKHDAWTMTYNDSGRGKELKGNSYDPFDQSVFDWLLKYSKDQTILADAGTSKTIYLPANTAVLEGSSSPTSGVTYTWAQVGNTPSVATLSGQNTATLTASDLNTKGNYSFVLTVTNTETNAIARDTANVTVRSFNVNAGNDVTVNTSSTTLRGSVSEAAPGGTFTYQWSQILGPNDSIYNGNPVNERVAVFSDPNIANPTISELVNGVYELELAVTDNSGVLERDYIKVTVQGLPDTPEVPDTITVDAGNDTTVTLPSESVTFTAVPSKEEGTTYNWAPVQTDTDLTLQNTQSATLTVTNLQRGTFSFVVTATNSQLTATDTVQLTVLTPNTGLEANAGGDTTVTLPIEQLEITGSGSDTYNNIIAYQWRKISGPDVTLEQADSAVLLVSNLQVGEYQFELTVTNDNESSETDTMTLIVEAEVCEAPVIDAIEDVAASLDQMPLEITLAISNADFSTDTITVTSDNQQVIADEAIIVDTTGGSAKLTVDTDSLGEANITVTVGSGACTASQSFKITVNPVTGIDDELADVMTIYPNPSDDGIFKGEWKEVVPKGASISVYTSGGTLVKVIKLEETQSQLTINLSSRASGTYILLIRDKNKARSYRLIKR